MPKAVNPTYPLQGLFGLIKPSGPTTMSLLDGLKPLLRESSLFVPDDTERKSYIEARKKGQVQRRKNKKFRDPVKMGQGGTLDPLADGVLVIGLNRGTKSLSQFLECSKEYYTTGILGCETDSYDSEGAIVRTAPWDHVTKEKLTEALASFRGEILQLPPVYSALKMDGKPLYEYARAGKPLPRPIQARKVTVHSLELVDWQEAAPSSNSTEDAESSSASSSGHRYKWPEKRLDAEASAAMEGVLKLIAESGSELPPASIDSAQAPLESSSSTSAPALDANADPEKTDATPSATTADTAKSGPEPRRTPPVFTLKMTVSSGTYVRSIVHDLAHAVGSAAHVVSLTRTRQGDFAVGPNYLTTQGRSHEEALITEVNADVNATSNVAESANETSVADVVNVDGAPAGSGEPSSSLVAPGTATVVESRTSNTDSASTPGADRPIDTNVDILAGDCISWEVFQQAMKAREDNPDYEVPEGQREEWEDAILAKLQALET